MISIECFNGLPVEHESFLIDRYASFITTCRYIEIYYAAYDINHMLVYNNGDLSELLVFGNKENTCVCFNSLVSLGQDIVPEFIKKVFEKYPAIKKIKIDASYKKYTLKKSVLFFKSDNHILNLPPTMDDYYLELGSSTRQKVKNRRIRLLKDFPEVNFITKYGNEIEEGIIDKIVQLNITRMKLMGRVSGIDAIYKNNIFKYSQHYGCVAYIEVNGEIVAGSINTVLNKSIFGHVTAYDNNFSKYNVGEICAFYLIQTSIEKGLTTFNFLWGESDLKKRLLAKPNLLFSYFIYRTYSFDYIYSKVNVLLYSVLIGLKFSKYSKPVKNAIQFYRRKKQKKLLSSKFINISV